jgi:hypothetical protein
MVRAISARHARDFRQRARLLEAATRAIATFSAQSPQAAKAAAEIVLLADEPTPSPPQQSSKVILPPGVDLHKKTTLPTDELPDDADRKVIPTRPEADMNKPGSFESMVRFASGSGPNPTAI